MIVIGGNDVVCIFIYDLGIEFWILGFDMQIV